ncbi:MAG: hypothetical protein EHM17_02830 [Verrucomicrobiaceae bacterium]|nr:MAG: hypothetical protein EHM17_02830 [Verrucomicrobiaceae bacterium]
MRFSRSILLPLVWLAASCASDKGSSSAPEPVKPLSQRLSESNGYKQDANGNWVPKTDKRSSFESQGESPYFKGEYGKKDYQTGDYSKKSWWGNKDYGRQPYTGKTDGSRFQQASRLDGQGARESGSAADVADAYQTGGYATSAARESATGGIQKSSDAETDARRRVFQQPEIIDWREQRSLSLEQSKGILGR